MLSIGLQIGHGHVKAATATGQSAVFPAVAAPAPASDFAGLGAARQVVDLAEDGLGRWLVGQDALDFAPGRLVSILDRTRYRNPSFTALARHAIDRVASNHPGPLRIMTGCPAAWFADSGTRADLEAALLEAASPWGRPVVTVAPEAAGVFYAHVFETGILDVARTRGQVGVVDAGYRDVNLALFSDARYVAGESIPGGAFEGLKECKRLISAAHGVELSLHQVDAAVRAGCVLVEGQERDLPAGTEQALVGSLDTIAATGRSLWPNGGRGLRVILVAGGGASVLGAALQRIFPQASILPDPQLAGARGFARAAQAQAEAQARRAA